MIIRLSRPFTTTEQRVADGIRRGLDYEKIGRELAALSGRKRPVSKHTVRSYVRNMATKIEGVGDMPPRWAIFVVVLLRDSR